MHIIPAIDIIDGKCVRLEKGDYQKSKQYHDDPLEVAKSFEQAGLKKLHLVDLDGARGGHVINLKVLESIATHTDLEIDFGGGVKSERDLRAVINAGANQVTLGSIAAKDPDQTRRWINEFGTERIILGADVLKGQIMISGWQKPSGKDLFTFLTDYLEDGVKYVLCTDIDRDGMLTGPPIDLYDQIISRFPDLKLIASGGVSSTGDLDALISTGVYGVVLGKAIYEKRLTLADLNRYTDVD